MTATPNVKPKRSVRQKYAKAAASVAAMAQSLANILPGTGTVLAADLFCGAGGATTALVMASEARGLDLEMVAVNHWQTAIDTHVLNYPRFVHYCQLVGKVSPRSAVPGGYLDLLMAGPECFPAGTLILTNSGLVPIEEVRPGHRVWTHAGRWRAVTSVMASVKDTVIVRGHGHFGLETTAEHPFLISRRRHAWDNETRRWKFEFADPKWENAKDLPFGDGKAFWCTPRRYTPSGLPDVSGRRGVEFTPEFWWMVGRWLGDGNLRFRGTKAEVHICCGFHEVDALREHLNFAPATSRQAGTGEYTWTERRLRTAHLFQTAHTGLATWLREHFGEHSYGKTIPAWALAMPCEWRKSLIDGYMSADGSTERTVKRSVVTVSKSLAVGIRLLAESLGHQSTLHFVPAGHNTIEGRTVTQRDRYMVTWVEDRKHEYCGDFDNLTWKRIRTVEDGRKGVTVYNLSVEDDESYVADGIVVHNCTNHSNAKGGKPRDDQSRCSAMDILWWLADLDVRNVLIENVREWQRWGRQRHKRDAVTGELMFTKDGDPWMEPDPEHEGEYFRLFLSYLKRLGYDFEYRVVCAADFGDPTTRKRLFLLCWKAGDAPTWPTPTHRPAGEVGRFPGCLPWVAARDVIDWSIPGESIYDREKNGKPELAVNTLRRIFTGIEKFSGLPFIVPNFTERDGQHPRTHSLSDPLPTVTGHGAGCVIDPCIVTLRGTDPEQIARSAQPISEPSPTVCGGGNHIGLAESFVVDIAHGSDRGDASRCRNPEDPLATMTAKGSFAVVEPLVMANRTNNVPHTAADPMVTQCTGNQLFLLEPSVVSMDTSGDGHDRRYPEAGRPLPTVTGLGDFAVIDPVLVGNGGPQGSGKPRPVSEPLGTVLAENHRGVARPFLVVMKGKSDASSLDMPSPTITATPHLYVTEPFLYNGYNNADGTPNAGKDLAEPIPAVCAQWNHHGIVETVVETVEAVAESVHPQIDPILLPHQHGASGVGNVRTTDGPFPTVTAQSSDIFLAEAVTTPIEGADSEEVTGAGSTANAFLIRYNGGKGAERRGQSVTDPMTTLDTSNRFALCQFYVRYNKNGQNVLSITEPLATVTAKDRFGLVELVTTGQQGVYEGHIVGWLDIRFRMLQPHELAGAHSFPIGYKFTGKKDDQVRQIGNSWPCRTGASLCGALLARKGGSGRSPGWKPATKAFRMDLADAVALMNRSEKATWQTLWEAAGEELILTGRHNASQGTIRMSGKNESKRHSAVRFERLADDATCAVVDALNDWQVV